MEVIDTGDADLAAIIDRLTDVELSALFDRLAPKLDTATLDEFERFLAERRSAGWRADPWTLAAHLDKTIKDWAYTRLLAQKFRAAALGQSKRQAWSLPAQVGKSTWLQNGCVWTLDMQPWRKLIYLTHSDSLAQEASDYIRGVARAHADELRFRLRTDRQARNRWKTDQGGGLLATGLGGGVAGFGGSVIVDDPIKNWEQAHSKTTRDKTWNEMTAVGGFRLAEDDFMIVAHTRWHLDDPTGRLIAFVESTGEPWEFVRLPMFAEDNDLLGRAKGEVLEADRYTPEAARARALLVGSYLAAALEQQDPQPEQGGEFKREWWKFSGAMPARFDELVSSWDVKLKDKEAGDYVVGMVVGRVGARFWGVDMFRHQWSQLQTRVAVALCSIRYPSARRHIIESTGYGPEVVEALRKGDPLFVLTDELADAVGATADERPALQARVRRGVQGVQGHSPKEKKEVRARRHSGSIEAGYFTLPEGQHWTAAFVDEWAAFPPKAGGHDDIVDATTQAMDRLAGGKATIMTTQDAGAAPLAAPSPAARATSTAGRARILR